MKIKGVDIMLATEREEFIRKLILEKRVVYVNNLADELGVTRPTVRNDLDKLVKKHNDLTRIHGGIMLKEEIMGKDLTDGITEYSERAFVNKEEKKAIAKKAIEFVKKGDTILLDSSSTCFEFASELVTFSEQLTVITNGISTGAILKQNRHINVLAIGGLLKANSNTIYDEFFSPILDNFNIDTYFFSASGLSLDGGFSENNLMEVKHKRTNVINSKKSIALVDSTKFNKDSSSTFCTFEEVDILITDANLDKSIEQQFDSCIKIIKADS